MQGSHVDFRGIFHKNIRDDHTERKGARKCMYSFPLSTSTPYTHPAPTRNVKESNGGAEVMREIFARSSVVCPLTKSLV